MNQNISHIFSLDRALEVASQVHTRNKKFVIKEFGTHLQKTIGKINFYAGSKRLIYLAVIPPRLFSYRIKINNTGEITRLFAEIDCHRLIE